MKRLSMSLPAVGLALALALSGAAFAPTPTPVNNPASTINTGKVTAPLVKKQYDYYWFTEPGDQYFDQQTLANEEVEQGLIYWGYTINTDPSGGTLIADGYMLPNVPHAAYPACFLYAH